MSSLISIAEFRKAARAKRAPAGGVFRLSTLPSEPVAGEDRRRRFCFSDGSVDRMGDTIDPEGWDTTDYAANPVALWAHDSMQPPIGRSHDVAVKGGRLMGDIEFIPPETYAFAETIFQMVTQGFLNAVSVGFLPIEYSFVENDPDRGWGIDFKRQQLLEISLCPIPANPNALGEARAKGIDTRPLVEWAEKILEGGGKHIISRAALQRLQKAAKEPTMAKPAKPRAGTKAEDPPEDVPTGDCGRDKDETCGMIDPAQCAVHGGGKSVDDDDDEKAIKRLRRLLRLARRTDDDPSGEEPPLAHEDAIRMAHKCMRTAKAFQAEAMGHYSKAMDHLDGVVDALDDVDPDTDPPADPDPDADPDGDKAARLRRAEARRRRLAAA